VTHPEPTNPDGRVERPWGWFETLAGGDHYQVKRLLIRSGRRLSLQRHHHRCEHWVVVAGSGELQVAEVVMAAVPGTTVFIPQGAIHRAQGGSDDLEIVEVQRGDWLSETDIERLADDFGRL